MKETEAFLSPGGFFQSSIIQQKLITCFVPFLPLSRHHVERCVRSQLCQQGNCGRTDVVEAVGGNMIYTPVQGQYFSSTGCKAVPAKINFFLWAEGKLDLRSARETPEGSQWKETESESVWIRGRSSISAPGTDSESRMPPAPGIKRESNS